MNNIFRLIKIIHVFAKYDALNFLRRFHIAPFTTSIFGIISKKSSKLREGERIAKALEELGPIFIKVGQSLSTRPDLLGEEIASDLSRLRDKLPAFSFDEVRQIIKLELNNDIENLYKKFNQTPIAAASISQVHKAITFSGEKVAVKILRPNIEKEFKKDLDLFHFIFKKIEKKIGKAKKFKLTDVIKNFENNIKIELNLRLEAASASELKDKNKDKSVYIPKVLWHLTSNRVLTLEWVDGISIFETEKLLEAKHNLKDIAKKVALMFFNQAYGNGFFHADLHPGNVLVGKDGNIILVDYGIMGRIDKQTQIYVAEILYGFLKRDYDHIAHVHFKADFVPSDKSLKVFSQACRSIGEPIMHQGMQNLSVARLLAQLFKITEDFDMPIKPELLLLQKTILIVEGISKKLHPDINIWQIAKPWIEDWAIDNIGIEAKVRDSCKEFFSFIFNELPAIIKKEQ